jgi:transcriptional regulator with XRE-family HTH domain
LIQFFDELLRHIDINLDATMLAASLAQLKRVGKRMDEQEQVPTEELPATVGARLRVARVAAGLGLEDVAARTKIAERHLVSIEEDRFSDLAGRTYAVGFSRAYARTVGLDEGEIADAVRTELDRDEQAYPRVLPKTFEPGDPARVPSARLAWTVAAGGVLTVVGLLYIFWPSFLSPQASLPDLLKDHGEGERQLAAQAVDATGRQLATGGAVVFTATERRVWVKFTDVEGSQLFQKEMSMGESYSVPTDAQGPLLWTARPDALEITIGGKSVGRLSDKPAIVKDVPVGSEALLRRLEADPSDRAKPATRDTAVWSPRAAHQPAQVSTPRLRPFPSARPNTSPPVNSNGSNVVAEPRPEPAASAAAPAPEPIASPVPIPAEMPEDAPIAVPAAEPVSTDSAAASTVSE